MTSEASGRMTQSRSSRGNISFVQAAMDGSYIEIENNTSGSKSKVQNLKGWSLTKKTTTGGEIRFNFDDYVVQPMAKLRIYARPFKPSGPIPGCDWIVNNQIDSWGLGGSILLLDEMKSEKASLKSTITNLK